MKTTRVWLPHPPLSVVLCLLWLFLVGSIAPGQLLLGAFLAWLIPFAFQGYWPEKSTVHNLPLLFRFILTVLFDILYSNGIVAIKILRGVRHLQPGFISLPLDLENEFAITLLASTISLTPGTVSANISADHSTLLIHCLDIDDEQTMIDQMKQRYEAPLKEIFECSSQP